MRRSDPIVHRGYRRPPCNDVVKHGQVVKGSSERSLSIETKGEDGKKGRDYRAASGPDSVKCTVKKAVLILNVVRVHVRTSLVLAL